MNTAKLVSILFFLISGLTSFADVKLGKLYSKNLSTGEYSLIAESADCSLEIDSNSITNVLDTDHGSPQYLTLFNYRLSGLPRSWSKYANGRAKINRYGEVINYGAQTIFETGFFSTVTVSFYLKNDTTVSEFLKNPSVFKEVLLIQSNSAKNYFSLKARSSDQAISCQLNQ